MDDRTSPNRVPRRPAGDTAPTRPRGRDLSDTARRKARPPARRSASRVWRLVAAVLGVAVALNLCLTSGFWVYYSAQAQGDAPLPPGPPAPPATGLPATPVLVAGTPPVTPTSIFPTVQPQAIHGAVNILMLGVDERPDQIGEPTRTDTLIVLRVDFDSGSARMLSLPRDMWVALPNLEGYGLTANRINTAYFYGERYDLPGGGPALAMETVTLNFGIRLDHYALINFNGFVKTVDALGGIDIDVPKAIFDDRFPTDDYGTIVFSVPAGSQHMDGLTALRYARTRHQDNDFERARRQQAVLLAIRDQAVSLDALSKLPELISIAGDSFRTDMTLPQMAGYALAGQRIDRDKIESYVIDESYLIGWRGAGGASLYIPDRQKIAPLIEQFLRP